MLPCPWEYRTSAWLWPVVLPKPKQSQVFPLPKWLVLPSFEKPLRLSPSRGRERTLALKQGAIIKPLSLKSFCSSEALSRDGRTPSEMPQRPCAPAAASDQSHGSPSGPIQLPSSCYGGDHDVGAPAGLQGLVQPRGRCTAGKNWLLASHFPLLSLLPWPHVLQMLIPSAG